MPELATSHAVHGVLVRIEGGRAAEPVRRLLSWYPCADGDPQPDVVFRARSVEQGIARRECEAGARPLFFHGPVQVFARDGAALVHDGSSLITVSGDGRVLDASVSDQSLARDEEFASVPVLIALVVALRLHGMFHVHAGAVVDPHLGRVMIAGQSGSGKTTLTLALTLGGADYLGDDALFLALRAGVPKVLPFLRCFHVADRTEAAFDLKLSREHASLAGKVSIDPREVFPGRERIEMLSPDVLLFPEVGVEKATSSSPIGPADALGRLMQSSALVVVDGIARVPDHLELLRRVVNDARSYRVVLGQDLLENPADVIARLR